MNDIVAVLESDVLTRAQQKPDPEAYVERLRACVTQTSRDQRGRPLWIIDRTGDCFRALWRAERGKDFRQPKPTGPTQTHANPKDGSRFGVGDALAWAFGMMGYQVNAGCSCKATQRWANERRWWEWTYPSVRRELLDRLTAEASRRKIIRCECKGGKCKRPSWRRLIVAGIRDRLRAAWRAIHAHGTRNHRGTEPANSTTSTCGRSAAGRGAGGRVIRR